MERLVVARRGQSREEMRGVELQSFRIEQRDEMRGMKAA